MSPISTPWATYRDLEQRWRGLTAVEQERATVLIEDAQCLIKDECAQWEQASAETLRRVVCSIVKRAMNAPLGDDALAGASSTSMTAGPFTQQVSFSNPGGDLYLTKAEKRSVNGRRGAAFEINLLKGGGDD